MFFELQLSGAVFARVIRSRLRALPLGLDLSVPDPSGGEYVVDQVVIGDATTIQREKAIDSSSGVQQEVPASTQSVWTLSPKNLANFTVPYLQVKQEVKILLVRATDLEANGPVATPPALTLTIFPVFNVELNAHDVERKVIDIFEVAARHTVQKGNYANQSRGWPENPYVASK